MTSMLSSVFCSTYASRDGLKRAALYFDKLVVPKFTTIWGAQGGGDKITSLEAVFCITPEALRPELDLLSREGILDVADLNRESGLDLLDSHKVQWESQFPRFHREVMERIESCWSHFKELEILRHGRSDSLLGGPGNSSAQAVVGEYFATLYVIADFMVQQHQLPLCSDSQMLLDLVARPYEDSDFLRRVEGNVSLNSLSESLLAFRVLNTYLPDLADVPLDGVLEARYKLRDELTRFRIEISALASSMKMAPLSKEGIREAEAVVRSTVDPAVADLKAKLETSRDNALLRLFKNIQSPKTLIPFVGTVFSDLSFVAAGFASIGLAALSAGIDTLVERRALVRSHRFAFLLSAQEALGRTKKASIPTSRKRQRVWLIARGGDEALVALELGGELVFVKTEVRKEIGALMDRHPRRGLGVLAQTIRETFNSRHEPE